MNEDLHRASFSSTPPRAMLEAMKQRVREITARNGGRSMAAVTKELKEYLTGWKQYFRRAETPGIFEDLDKWVRRRLRQVQLKQWKRGTTIYRELRRRGAPEDVARKVAAKYPDLPEAHLAVADLSARAPRMSAGWWSAPSGARTAEASSCPWPWAHSTDSTCAFMIRPGQVLKLISTTSSAAAT